MAIYNYLLAFTIIAAPETDPISPKWINLIPQIKFVAQSLELMDPREEKFMFAQKDRFESDVKELRKRYQKLHDAPIVFDAIRFPHPKQVHKWLKLNRKYRKFLVARAEIDTLNKAFYDRAIEDADRLHILWTNIRNTRLGYLYNFKRREYLKLARGQMGMQNYYNGTYPPPVPLWYFQEIDD